MSAECKKCGAPVVPVKREEVDALMDKIIRLIADSGIVGNANINLVTTDGDESVNLWPKCECVDPDCGANRMCGYANLLHDMADSMRDGDTVETHHDEEDPQVH